APVLLPVPSWQSVVRVGAGAGGEGILCRRQSGGPGTDGRRVPGGPWHLCGPVAGRARLALGRRITYSTDQRRRLRMRKSTLALTISLYHSVTTVQAAMPFFDAANVVQTTLTAINSFQSTLKEALIIEHQVEQIANQAKALAQGDLNLTASTLNLLP